jgi:hypothetical protein
MTQYFVDNGGNYLGGYDGAEPPEGAIEVPHAPANGADTWAGGVWVATPAVPTAVTRRQARQALLLAGLLDNVQPAINAIPDATARGLAQIEWDDSLEFQRERPLVISIGAAIGLDAAGLDGLFVQAAAL